MKLKLFIWDGFCPDYTGGLAFAIAKDEEEAINTVNRLLTDEGEYTSVAGGLIFDYVSEDQTKIAKNEDFDRFPMEKCPGRLF